MADEAYIHGYRVLERVGEGGSGIVLRVRDASGRELAMKLLGKEASPDLRRRFRREARALARLEHPNVVRVHRAGAAGSDLFYVMDLVEGSDLEEVLAEEGPLPWRRASEIVRQVAGALGDVHAEGIVHRDVTPRNVLLGPHGPILTDFGLARVVEAGPSVTTTGTILGTPAYLPPEQAAGEPDRVGPASDVYGATATLYTLLAGEPPIAPRPDEARVGFFYRVLHEEPPPPETEDELPEGLVEIIRRGLAKDPDERWSDGSGLADALDALLAGSPDPAGWVGRPRSARPAGRRLLRAAVPGVLLLLLGIALLLWSARSGGPEDPTSPAPATLPETARSFARVERSRIRGSLEDAVRRDDPGALEPLLAEAAPDAFRERLGARLGRDGLPGGGSLPPTVLDGALETFGAKGLQARIEAGRAHLALDREGTGEVLRRVARAVVLDPSGPGGREACSVIARLAEARETSVPELSRTVANELGRAGELAGALDLLVGAVVAWPGSFPDGLPTLLDHLRPVRRIGLPADLATPVDVDGEGGPPELLVGRSSLVRVIDPRTGRSFARWDADARVTALAVVDLEGAGRPALAVARELTTGEVQLSVQWSVREWTARRHELASGPGPVAVAPGRVDHRPGEDLVILRPGRTGFTFVGQGDDGDSYLQIRVRTDRRLGGSLAVCRTGEDHPDRIVLGLAPEAGTGFVTYSTAADGPDHIRVRWRRAIDGAALDLAPVARPGTADGLAFLVRTGSELGIRTYRPRGHEEGTLEWEPVGFANLEGTVPGPSPGLLTLEGRPERTSHLLAVGGPEDDRRLVGMEPGTSPGPVEILRLALGSARPLAATDLDGDGDEELVLAGSVLRVAGLRGTETPLRRPSPLACRALAVASLLDELGGTGAALDLLDGMARRPDLPTPDEVHLGLRAARLASDELPDEALHRLEAITTRPDLGPQERARVHRIRETLDR